MIGLDFVKSVDKNWKKHLTYIDGSPYYEDYCPLGNCKCRREDCTFWNNHAETCRYTTKADTAEILYQNNRSQSELLIDKDLEKKIDEKVDKILSKF